MNLVAGKIQSAESTIAGFSTLFFNRISFKVAGFVFLVLSFVFFELLFPASTSGQNLNLSFSLDSPHQVETESLFSQKTFTQKEFIAYSSVTVVDKNLASGETKIVQEGRKGEKVYETKVVYHHDEEFSKTTRLVKSTPPQQEVLAVAQSVNTVETPEGKFNYSQKLTVWATSYDPNCYGCSGITATGLKAGYGIIAVDPTVIPLGSKVYVPNYGIAIAGDTGGAIKGNKIDLGFDDISKGWWSSRYTDIYILSD
jgi:3D (Asp-Asp-Asp) domain-containing protein